MVRHENIESKLAALRRYRELLDRYRARPFPELRADPDLLGATERYLFLAVQAAIDLAEMTCRLRDLGRPDSMAHGFELLRRNAVITDVLADSLIRMIGFRNALGHGYENLDYGIVEDVLRNRLADIDQFAEIIRRQT